MRADKGAGRSYWLAIGIHWGVMALGELGEVPDTSTLLVTLLLQPAPPPVVDLG